MQQCEGVMGKAKPNEANDNEVETATIIGPEAQEAPDAKRVLLPKMHAAKDCFI